MYAVKADSGRPIEVDSPSSRLNSSVSTFLVLALRRSRRKVHCLPVSTQSRQGAPGDGMSQRCRRERQLSHGLREYKLHNTMHT